MKVLLQEHAKNKEAIEHLKHEYEVGKDLESKYVIQIYDYNGSYGRALVSMQLFVARNVKQMVREQPDFLAHHAQDIIRRCAKGLKYFHEQGWVHCDVKPDNFLVNTNVGVKLIDFSIAEKAKKSGGLSALFGRRSKTIRGTRSYMSPEQIRGKHMDARSDIYSFGCMLYEILASKPPFSGTSGDDLLNRHLKTAPPAVQAQNNRVSNEMAALIMRMMSKDPEKRPQSVHQFLEEYRTIRVYRPGLQPALAES